MPFIGWMVGWLVDFQIGITAFIFFLILFLSHQSWMKELYTTSKPVPKLALMAEI